jgi:hypothetical protein
MHSQIAYLSFRLPIAHYILKNSKTKGDSFDIHTCVLDWAALHSEVRMTFGQRLYFLLRTYTYTTVWQRSLKTEAAWSKV